MLRLYAGVHDLWVDKNYGRVACIWCTIKFSGFITDFSSYYVADNVTKVIPARCPSHNAFKCTGECGFDGCNTHFMEQDALQEHINRGREKKISLTSSCARVLRTQCLFFVLLLLLFHFILIYKMYSSPNSIYQFDHFSLFIFTGVFFPKVN